MNEGSGSYHDSSYQSRYPNLKSLESKFSNTKSPEDIQSRRTRMDFSSDSESQVSSLSQITSEHHYADNEEERQNSQSTQYSYPPLDEEMEELVDAMGTRLPESSQSTHTDDEESQSQFQSQSSAYTTAPPFSQRSESDDYPPLPELTPEFENLLDAVGIPLPISRDQSQTQSSLQSGYQSFSQSQSHELSQGTSGSSQLWFDTIDEAGDDGDGTPKRSQSPLPALSEVNPQVSANKKDENLEAKKKFEMERKFQHLSLDDPCSSSQLHRSFHPHPLSATKLNQFFHHGKCELKIWRDYWMPRTTVRESFGIERERDQTFERRCDDRNAQNMNGDPSSNRNDVELDEEALPTSLKSALFKAGLTWESTLFSTLDNAGLLLDLCKHGDENTSTSHSTKGTIPFNEWVSRVIFGESRERVYVSGSEFEGMRVGDIFPSNEGNSKVQNGSGDDDDEWNGENVRFGIWKPDLIEVRKEWIEVVSEEDDNKAGKFTPSRSRGGKKRGRGGKSSPGRSSPKPSPKTRPHSTSSVSSTRIPWSGSFAQEGSNSQHRRRKLAVRYMIIDAKSSARAKTSHQVQIWFYHVCFAKLVRDYMTARSGSQHENGMTSEDGIGDGIDIEFIPSREGGVWLPPPVTPRQIPQSVTHSQMSLSTESQENGVLPPGAHLFASLKQFPYSTINPQLKQLLTQHLPKILSIPPAPLTASVSSSTSSSVSILPAPRSSRTSQPPYDSPSLSWQYSPSCRGCPFEQDCRKEVVKSGRLGAMNGLILGRDTEVLKEVVDILRRGWDNASADTPMIGGSGRERRNLTDLEELDKLFGEGSDCETRRKRFEEEWEGTARKARKVLGVKRGRNLPKISNNDNSINGRSSPAKNGTGKGKRKRQSNDSVFPVSARLRAAMNGEVMLTGNRSYTLPRYEDVAIVVSLLVDPSDSNNRNAIATYSLQCFSHSDLSHFSMPGNSAQVQIDNQTAMRSWKWVGWNGRELIRDLTALFRAFLRQEASRPRTQVYVFSQKEKDTLIKTLIDHALSIDDLPSSGERESEDIRMLIGALCDGSQTLATSYQPDLLSGALGEWMTSKSGALSKIEKCEVLRRMGIPEAKIRGKKVDELSEMIKVELELMKSGNGSGNGSESSAKATIGRVPKVVVVQTEIDRLVCLPIPGYWRLEDLSNLALHGFCSIPSEDDVYQVCMESLASSRNVRDTGIAQRGLGTLNVLHWIRNQVMEAESKLSSTLTAGDEGLERELKSSSRLLLNDAPVVSAPFIVFCREPDLRRLMFMYQFEILLRLSELWNNRLDGCPEAPLLRLRNFFTDPTESKNKTFVFDVLDGTLDLPPSDKQQDFQLFEWMLVDVAAVEEHAIAPELLVDDLPVSGIVFPLTKKTSSRWDRQDPLVQKTVFVGALKDLVLEDNQTRAHFSIWSKWGTMLQPGHVYRLSPRLIDFNSSKILKNLVQIDLEMFSSGAQSASPFVRLLRDPIDFAKESSFPGAAQLKSEEGIQRQLREIARLEPNSGPASGLIFKQSQRMALRKMISSKLAVCFGPPGTGKTYTLALSLLHTLDIMSREKQQFSTIWITAVTHAAIDAFLSKLNYLISLYRSIPNLDLDWLDDFHVERVLQGSAHKAIASTSVTLFAGTTYQLFNFATKNKPKIDLLIIDESSQLSVGAAGLVLRWLSDQGKVLIAGDNLQLGTIFAGTYPETDSKLFGSILDCSMRMEISQDDEDANSEAIVSQPSVPSTNPVVQLLENFRLNADLSQFVELIYARRFRPQKAQSKDLGQRLFHRLAILPTTSSFLDIHTRKLLLGLGEVMTTGESADLVPPKTSALDDPSIPKSLSAAARAVSLACVTLRVSLDASRFPREVHTRAEAEVVASLVSKLQTCFPMESIFVAAPHRVQVQACRTAVEERTKSRTSDETRVFNGEARPTNLLRIDTVERLQGSEAAFVIALFSHTHKPTLSADLPFLFERRRLNVAISRAKSLCILCTSEGVMVPPVEVLADEKVAAGFEHLKAFQERAWNMDLDIDL